MWTYIFCDVSTSSEILMEDSVLVSESHLSLRAGFSSYFQLTSLRFPGLMLTCSLISHVHSYSFSLSLSLSICFSHSLVLSFSLSPSLLPSLPPLIP